MLRDPGSPARLSSPARFEGNLAGFLGQSALCRPGDLILVAFSAGPDSCALLFALARLAPHLRLRLHAVHVDHGLDADSARRASSARRLAAEAAVPLAVERLRPAHLWRGRDGIEAAARRQRYAVLEEHADRLGAHFIATAHHADDQAETVLLRLLFGSHLAGLSGIRERSGRLLRPLLTVRRAEILRYLAARRIHPVEDPTNRDPAVPRNAVRASLLPTLVDENPDLVERLGRLARIARRADRRLTTRLDVLLRPQAVDRGDEQHGVEIELADLRNLPEVLWRPALALLHRRAGRTYPPGSSAFLELRRQLRRGGRIGCDCGDGWSWQRRGDRLCLTPPEPKLADFAYTVEMPGQVEVPELGLKIRLRRVDVAPWMFVQHPARCALAVPVKPNRRAVVRNRRPGDRLRPLGGPGSRKLKALLIDKKVSPADRERLPLLVIDDRIAWVPGVAIDEAFKITDETQVWSVEILGR